MDSFWVGWFAGVGTVIVLHLLKQCRRKRPPRAREAVNLRATLTLINSSTGEEKEATMATKVPPGFNVRIAVTPLDADGQPTNIDLQDREVGWASSVPEVTVSVDPGGLSALVVAPEGFRGAVQVQADADADLDAGEDRSILMLADLDYVGGEAQVLQGNVTLEPKV